MTGLPTEQLAHLKQRIERRLADSPYDEYAEIARLLTEELTAQNVELAKWKAEVAEMREARAAESWKEAQC